MLPTEVTYSTWEQFKTYTPNADQKTIPEADWKTIALRAEGILDSYVGYTKKFDPTQARKFPINECGVSTMPNDIVMAHIEITAWQIREGEPTSSNDQTAKSESWNNSGYAVVYKDGQTKDTEQMILPPYVLRLLSPFQDKGTSLTY